MTCSIPKKLHLYWDGSPMSFLNFLTIKSFETYNPGWEIFLHMPTKRSDTKTWQTYNHKVTYQGTDYFYLIKDTNVQIKTVNFEELGFDEDASEVHKSDFIRYYLLSTEGGVWSDMDVLFLKPIDTSRLFDDDKINLAIAFYDNYYSIGLLASSPDSPFFERLVTETKRLFNPQHYQSIGNEMIKKLFPKPHFITKKYPDINLWIMPNSFYLPVKAKLNLISEIFNGDISHHIKDDTVGIHWFNGAPCATEFLNNFELDQINKNTTMYKLIEPYLDLKNKN